MMTFSPMSLGFPLPLRPNRPKQHLKHLSNNNLQYEKKKGKYIFSFQSMPKIYFVKTSVKL